MNYLKPFVLMALLFLCSNVGAQTLASKKWKATFGSPLDSIPYGNTVALDTFGNLVIVGNTVQENKTDADILIQKMSPGGESEWEVYWDGAYEGDDFAVKVFTKGNYIYVAGATETEEGFDYVTLKVDLEGNIEWAATYDGPGEGNDFPVAVAADNNGGVYVTGTSMSDASGEDFATVKYNVEGIQEWAARYDYDGYQDIALAMEVSPEGEVYVAGGSSSSPINREYTIIHYSPEGNQDDIDRKNTTETASLDIITALALDEATGDVFATGVVSSDGINYNVKTVKYEDDLTEDWAHTFDSDGGYDEARAIKLDPSGNVYVAGLRSDMDNGGRDMMLVKYNNDGTFRWEQNSPYAHIADNTEGYSFDLDDQANIYCIAAQYNGTSMKTVITMYDSSGAFHFDRDPYPNSDSLIRPSDIKVTTNGMYIFATGTKGKDNDLNYYTYNYETFRRDSSMFYDSIGNPVFVKYELVARFDPSVIKRDVVNDDEVEFGSLHTYLNTSTVADILAKLTSPCESPDCNVKMVKIFTGMKTTDTIAISRLGDTVEVPDFWTAFSLQFPRGVDIRVADDYLDSLFPVIRYVHPSPYFTFQATSNDSQYNYQSALHSTVFFDDAHINMEEAWDIQPGGKPNVHVGVFDQQVDYTHDEFNYNPSNKSSKVVDGYNFYAKKRLREVAVSDDYQFSHATAVAGIIGATRNNQKGIAGIAGSNNDSTPNTGVSLYSLKINPFNYTAFTDYNLNFMYDAIVTSCLAPSATTKDFDYELDIQNHSWTLSKYRNIKWWIDTNLTLLREAVHFANRMQVTIVAARGNGGADPRPYNENYPAVIDDDWVLTVGGTGNDGEYCTDSNGCSFISQPDRGWEIDVAAPALGSLVTTTKFGGGYKEFGGTSAAAPQVAGVAALLMSYLHEVPYMQVQHLAPEDVEQILQMTATDTDFPGPDSLTGYGRLNAGAALEAVKRPNRFLLHLEGKPASIVIIPALTNDTVTVPERYQNAAKVWFKDGGYIIEAYEVVATFKHHLDPDQAIVAGWGRSSSSNTLDDVKDGDFLYPRERVKLSYLSRDTAILRGYFYRVKGAITNWLGWWPRDFNTDTSKVLMAYTLLIHDSIPNNIAKIAEWDYTMNIYPNPTTGNQTLTVTTEKPEDLDIKLYDVTGKLLATVYNGSVSPGEQRYNIEMSGYAQGIYFCRVDVSGTAKTLKIIKQ